jgi:hypothetical protein
MDIGIMLVIALVGLARVHWERNQERIEKRAKQMNGDFA